MTGLVHALTNGDEIAGCLCGDWHNVSFYLKLEREKVLRGVESDFHRDGCNPPCLAFTAGEWDTTRDNLLVSPTPRNQRTPGADIRKDSGENGDPHDPQPGDSA